MFRGFRVSACYYSYMHPPLTLTALKAVLRDLEARHQAALDETLTRIRARQLERIKAELARISTSRT